MAEALAASIAEVLDRLVHATGCALALVASRRGGDFLIEEASPPRELAGTRLRIPALPVEDAGPLQLSTADMRLPLDWTLACGARPDYVTIDPLGAGGRFLVAAGTGPAPDTATLSLAADRLAAIFARGHGTWRDLAIALDIRDLVDHLPFPVVFIDSRAFNALVNDPARELLGLAGDVEGGPAVHLALRSLVSASGADPALALAADHEFRVFDLVHGDREFEVTIRSIERERLVGRLWVFRHVTAEREAARFKDELIANVSHELRTPLTSIVGALSLLKRLLPAPVGPDVERLLTIAENNAARLGRLVDDLLDAGRLEAGRLEIVPREVDLGWLVANTIELNRPYADRLEVHLAFARPRRRCMGLVDPDRMTQVIGNVLSNAAKFSPRGATVRIVLEPAGARARIRVIDQGRGMTPEFQQRLFTRFVRERDDAGQQPGTGLGLTIAKGIVEAMGGTIAIASAVDRGTTVTIEVPLAVPPRRQTPSAEVSADG